jgi:hypothetical protein
MTSLLPLSRVLFLHVENGSNNVIMIIKINYAYGLSSGAPTC